MFSLVPLTSSYHVLTVYILNLVDSAAFITSGHWRSIVRTCSVYIISKDDRKLYANKEITVQTAIFQGSDIGPVLMLKPLMG